MFRASDAQVVNSWLLWRLSKTETAEEVEKVFGRLSDVFCGALCAELGWECGWLEIESGHENGTHVHSDENPFGMTAIRVGNRNYVGGAHVHLGKSIIGGQRLSCVLREVSALVGEEFLNDTLRCVCRSAANTLLREQQGMKESKTILRNGMGDMMTDRPMDRVTLSGDLVVPEKTSKDYNPDRLKKYDQQMSDAKVGDIAAALGESLDEVMNRRDASAEEVMFKQFFNVGSHGVSVLDKTFSSFRMALMLMGFDAVLDKDYEIVQTVNFRWGRLVPVAYEMFQIGLNEEKRLMIGAVRFCKSKTSGKKVAVRSGIGFTSSGPQLEFSLATLPDDISMAQEIVQKAEQWAKDNNYFRGKKMGADGKFLNVGKYGWDDVVLDPEMKDTIFDDIVGFLNHEQLYRKNNLPFKRGVILYGKPGSGKTLLGKVIASQVDTSFIWVTAAQASSPAFIKDLFALAREIAPSVLFFEDIDMYTTDRLYHHFDPKVGELLAQMDGMEENNGMVVVATTNRLDVIEKALSERPSRFDRRYSLDQMSLETCQKMVQTKLGNAVLVGVTVPEIARMVMGLNGSFIQEVVISAKRKAISRGLVDSQGIVILDRNLMQEATDEVMLAFDIVLDKLARGEYQIEDAEARDKDVPNPKVGIWSKEDRVVLTKAEVSAEPKEKVTLATNKLPKNVNLTHTEKGEVDSETKTALTAVAMAAEHDDRARVAPYLDDKNLDEWMIALTGSMLKDIEFDKVERSVLRKVFRTLILCRNVRKSVGEGTDPTTDREMMGKLLHSMDMLSDRYYWVHTLARIETEFGRTVNLPFNPYRDQTSRDSALKVFDQVIGLVKSSREIEDEINKKNGVYVPPVQEYDKPDYKFNEPAGGNVSHPGLNK